MVKKILKGLNKKSKKLGYQKTMLFILKITDSKFRVVNKSVELRSVLKNDPVIVVADHTVQTDAITLIAAQEHRQDGHLVISSNFLGMLPNLDKHLIPVYINHRQLDRADRFRFLTRLFRKIHWSEDYSVEVSHQKNIESIKRAVSIVKKGGMVSMCPGGGGKNGQWFSGIGYLINGAVANKKTKIIMAYLEGNSMWDYARLIPGVSALMPELRVTYSAEESILVYDGMKPKEITENLSNKYHKWVSGLPKQDKWWKKIINKIPSVPENAYYLARCLVLWIMARTTS